MLPWPIFSPRVTPSISVTDVVVARTSTPGMR